MGEWGRVFSRNVSFLEILIYFWVFLMNLVSAYETEIESFNTWTQAGADDPE